MGGLIARRRRREGARARRYRAGWALGDLPSGKIAVLGDPQDAAFADFEGETDE
jgi:hypothetical protein